MEYGIRRYEAAQRLFWFLFFLICLGIAYPVAKSYRGASADLSALSGSFQPEQLKSTAFWTQVQWVHIDPLGGILVYLVWAAVLFLGVRLIWLLVQFVGKSYVRRMLAQLVPQATSSRVKSSMIEESTNPEQFFPAKTILHEIQQNPLRFVFHALQRLRLMLTNHQGILSSEDLTEKERRIVEIDWQVLWASWAPFRWVVWLMPLLALVQTVWLFYLQLEPALTGQKEIQDIFTPVLTSLLPLIQMIFVALLLTLGRGLLNRFENLYLSNVDALFYDQFLSRVPFHSNDTLILLEAMQRHFQELQAALERLQGSAGKEQEMGRAQQ